MANMRKKGKNTCAHTHLPCGENIGWVQSFNKLSEPFVLHNNERLGIEPDRYIGRPNTG